MHRAAGQLHLNVDAPRLDAFEGHGDHPSRHSPKNPLLSQDLSTSEHIGKFGSRTNKEQSERVWRISDLTAALDTSRKLHSSAGYSEAMKTCISALTSRSSGVKPLKPPCGMPSQTCSSARTPARRSLRCIRMALDRKMSRPPACRNVGGKAATSPSSGDR